MECPGKCSKCKWVIITLLAVVIAWFVWGCTPLYVGTLGANVYHKPGCKYVEKSLDKYGKIKRIEYHTNLHKNLSGRKPCPMCIK